MDDDVPPAVEFLGGTSDAGAEEVLADPPSGPGRTGVVVLAGALVVVALVGAVIARGRTGDRPSAARRAEPERSTAKVVPGPVPVAAAPAQAGSAALIECPAGAQCSEWTHPPAETVAALRSAFPRAVLRTAATVLANRTGHFEPDLLRRVLVAQDGSRTIRIAIRPDSAPRSPAGGERPRNGPRIEVRGHLAGYRVCVAVSGPGAGEVSPRASRLAADARLLAPL